MIKILCIIGLILFIAYGFKLAASDEGQEILIPASRIPSDIKTNCTKESDYPEIYSCEHKRAFCIVLSPGGQAQLQCKFY